MKAADMMTTTLITVTPTDTLGRVARILVEKNITGCPVVSNGALVGVVTQTDIVRAMDVYEKINKKDYFPLILSAIKQGSRTGMKRLLGKKVKDFMKDEVVSVDSGESVYKIASLINRHKIDRLPVVKNGKLVGILTKKDIMKFLGKVAK